MTHILNVLRLSLAACTLGVAPLAAAQDADVLGNWDVTVTTAQGPASAPLVLKKDGDKIVGTFATPQGDQPVEATVKEKTVTIWFSVRTPNGPVNTTMTGTVENDTIKGTLDFGGRPGGEWSAKRAAPAAASTAAKPSIDVTGTWTFQVETAAGSGSPTMTFKQEGEKLSGQYSGQLGEAPLTGTVKGNAIEFTFDVSVEGNALRVVYKGTVEKDTMKGALNLGGLAEGTFSARKKS